jgi:hypothetical protein
MHHQSSQNVVFTGPILLSQYLRELPITIDPLTLLPQPVPSLPNLFDTRS